MKLIAKPKLLGGKSEIYMTKSGTFYLYNHFIGFYKKIKYSEIDLDGYELTLFGSQLFDVKEK